VWHSHQKTKDILKTNPRMSDCYLVWLSEIKYCTFFMAKQLWSCLMQVYLGQTIDPSKVFGVHKLSHGSMAVAEDDVRRSLVYLMHSELWEASSLCDEGFCQCLASNSYGTAMSNVTYLQRAVLDSYGGGTVIVEKRGLTEGQPFTLPYKPTKVGSITRINRMSTIYAYFLYLVGLYL